MQKAVLLDTSFLIRFVNDKDPLFKNATDYFRYFLENEYSLFVSTISIAEFCVVGRVDDLPLKVLKILPFNLNHSVRTGEFAKILFSARKNSDIQFVTRNLIPNDSKLFAQADLEPSILFFVTSDTECQSAYRFIHDRTELHFSILDLKTTYSQVFGVLEF